MKIREGTFLIGGEGGGGGGGGGPGYFRNFWPKKSGPSHFPDWIYAWPFINTYTKACDPPPPPTRQNKINRTGLDCKIPISCRPWGWTSYPCTFPITRSRSKGRKLKRSKWSKRTLAACCTIQWGVNNLCSPHSEMHTNKRPHHFPRWKLTHKVIQ